MMFRIWLMLWSCFRLNKSLRKKRNVPEHELIQYKRLLRDLGCQFGHKDLLLQQIYLVQMSQELNWTLETLWKWHDGRGMRELLAFPSFCLSYQWFKTIIQQNCLPFFRIFFQQTEWLITIQFHFRRHWLFGEKVQVAKQKKDKNGLSEKEKSEPKPKRVRGWLPRNCAVELVNPESDDEQEHFTAKKTNWRWEETKPNPSVDLFYCDEYKLHDMF